MATPDIGLPQLALLFGMVLVPCLVLGWIGLRLSQPIGLGILRMTVQLALVGVYLKRSSPSTIPG